MLAPRDSQGIAEAWGNEYHYIRLRVHYGPEAIESNIF